MTSRDEELTRKNIRMGLTVLAVIVGMVVLSFASVPLYRLFCQMTGFGGTPQIGKAAGNVKILDRDITIRFNTDVSGDLPWTFRAETPSVTLKIGQQGMVSFYARNNTSKSIEGTAIFNVLPETAGIYFHKIQCFCFDLQTLEAGKDAYMPVVFYIDPAIVDDPDLKGIDTLTLSYTFFRADNVGGGLEESLKDR